MKIGQQPDNAPSSAPAAASVPAKPVSAAPAAPTPPSGKGAKSPGVGVTVSELARTLEQTRNSGAAEVDMDKVEAMRQAIAQKSYVVSPETIADKLLANAREMLQRTRS